MFFLVLSVLVSCNVEFIDGDGNINDYIYPYLEFTPLEDGKSCSVSVVAGYAPDEIHIPSRIVSDSGTLAVTFFSGFQKASDAVNLEKITLESGLTQLGGTILDKAVRPVTIAVSGNDTDVWGKLPSAVCAGKEFDSWYIEGTEIAVHEGDRMISGHTSIVPRFRDHELVLTAEVAPSCFFSGKKAHYRCLRCSSLFSDSTALNRISAEELVMPPSHQMVRVEGESASCNLDGEAPHYWCTVCLGSYYDEGGEYYLLAEDIVLPATGHSLEKIPAVNATCLENGNREHYRCRFCKDLFEDSLAVEELTADEVRIDASGHDSSGRGSDAEYHWTECSRCHLRGKESLHSFTLISSEAATSSSKGTRTYECSCGLKKTEDIRPEGEHHWEESKIAPTCTEYGYTAYKCTDKGCSAEYAGDYVNPAGHDFLEYEYSQSCSRRGKYYECRTCGKCFARCGASSHEIPRPSDNAGHVWGTGYSENRAAGGHSQECVICGAKGEIREHDFSHIEENRARKSSLTCTRRALFFRSCTECGSLDSVTFESGECMGHCAAVRTEAVSSNCTLNGHSAYYSCSRECCRNRVFSDEALSVEVTYDSLVLPLGDHVFDGRKFNITDDDHIYVCDVCGKEIRKESHRKTWHHDSSGHWMSCSVCFFSTGRSSHTMTGEEGHRICSYCGYVETESQTDLPGFSVRLRDKEPDGLLTAVRREGTTVWDFTLASTNEENAPVSLYIWYVENEKKQEGEKNTFTLDAPERHSYRVMCVFVSDGRYASRSMTVTGGEKGN